nr:reverse transcriptase domain-containing protein [Tanacetum cinerariifolium]
MVAATKPPTIQSAILKAEVLTDKAVRNGSLNKSGEKRGDGGEPSKEGNVKGDNKRARIGKVANLSTYPSKRFNSFCYDDDDDDEDYNFAITPNKPDNSLSIGDEHPDTISVMESDEFIKSSVENIIPILNEPEGESECDVPAREEFTTFSNIIFDAEYEFDSSDDQSFYDEDVPKKIFSNPLFDEEIIPMKIDQHHYNAESDLIESLRTYDSSIIISSKIDSLFDEFAGELALLKSIPPGIDETDCDFEEEIRLDSDSLMEEINLSFTLDYPMPSSIEDGDYDSERDILILKYLLCNDTLSLFEKESFHFDIPSFACPPAKPPDGNTGILNVKIMGDISEQIVHIPKLMITLAPNKEKSSDHLSHLGLKASQHFATCPMMIH